MLWLLDHTSPGSLRYRHRCWHRTPADELAWDSATQSATGSWYYSGVRSDGGVIGPIPACGWTMTFTITRNDAGYDTSSGCTQADSFPETSGDCTQTVFDGLRFDLEQMLYGLEAPLCTRDEFP